MCAYPQGNCSGLGVLCFAAEPNYAVYTVRTRGNATPIAGRNPHATARILVHSGRDPADGYVIMTAGGITILDYYRRKLFLGFRPDLGIITADVALLLLGSLAIMTAGCLKTFQGRLDGMEASISRSDPRPG
jgi:hypothetical protein